jgi:hypothetical protein
MVFTQERVGLRAAIASSLVAMGYAFQANHPSFARVGSALMVAVDPSTITKKEYQDICGVSFDDRSLVERLKSTNFLYPKHVEVIEDIAPIAGQMVDDIVSKGSNYDIKRTSCLHVCDTGCKHVTLFYGILPQLTHVSPLV